MGFLGGFEWLIIILVLFFFFGARKIPDMARGLGQGIREFRNATKEGELQDKQEESEEKRE